MRSIRFLAASILLCCLAPNVSATLIGDTVDFSYFSVEPAEFRLTGSLVVTNEIELSTCDTEGSDACRLFVETDIKESSIYTRVSNFSGFERTFAYSTFSTFTSLDLGNDIVGLQILTNTFPVEILCSSGSDSLMCFNSRYVLPPNSSFEIEIALLTAAVPEPSALGLFAIGLLGLMKRTRGRKLS